MQPFFGLLAAWMGAFPFTDSMYGEGGDIRARCHFVVSRSGTLVGFFHTTPTKASLALQG